jgi:hypothetical protein
MAILSVEENTGFHCRSILTQIAKNGQSRAKMSAETARDDTASQRVLMHDQV